MPLNIVVGTQWGDEGKGRVVDLLAKHSDYVARFNGGDNAGHTVTVKDKTFKLHLTPSGVIHEHIVCVIGNGVAINPRVLLSEMGKLESLGIPISPERLIISHAAHIITPAHRALDRAQELARGKAHIGTTLRGIGPAYTDKVTRSGIRMHSMLSLEDFAERVEQHVSVVNLRLEREFNFNTLDSQLLTKNFVDYAHRLTPYIGDVSSLLTEALKKGKQVLAEGAQGTLLDLDHGTYPFVTSSTPTAAGALVGLGLGVHWVDRVIGVTKAFQTRVGEGPLPTEVFGDVALHLRGTGSNPWDEFGTTTGRPRRVGWLDGVLLNYSGRINGLTELFITKLDILSGLNKLYLCVGYRAGEYTYEDIPFGPSNLTPFDPIYEELPGWQEDIREVRSWDQLPQAARAYVSRIEELTDIPVKHISVGPERNQVIKLD